MAVPSEVNDGHSRLLAGSLTASGILPIVTSGLPTVDCNNFDLWCQFGSGLLIWSTTNWLPPSPQLMANFRQPHVLFVSLTVTASRYRSLKLSYSLWFYWPTVGLPVLCNRMARSRRSCQLNNLMISLRGQMGLWLNRVLTVRFSTIG